MRRPPAPVVATALFLAVAGGAAGATGEEVRALAEQARDDPAALERLKDVREVDGRPVDFRRALGAVEGEQLRERLEVLAEGDGGTGAAAVADPRAEAADVLADDRFHESDIPRPLHGALVWLGERLRWAAQPFEWLADRVPGGEWTVWGLVAALVLVAAGLVAGRIARNSASRTVERARRLRVAPDVDPRDLEREADAAERVGDFDGALRLRFRAGLLRLARAEVVPARSSLTSGEARRLLRLAEFDVLARDLDEVVYGGRKASGDDVERSRAGWPRVLELAVRR